jgi:hypothetical protein
VRINSHPPIMLPVSPPTSSYTHKVHIPFQSPPKMNVRNQSFVFTLFMKISFHFNTHNFSLLSHTQT